MYQCEKHGELESEWCGVCLTIVKCDCKNQTYTRFKDLSYDSEDGEKTITIRLHHCETCGEPSYIDF